MNFIAGGGALNTAFAVVQTEPGGGGNRYQSLRLIDRVEGSLPVVEMEVPYRVYKHGGSGVARHRVEGGTRHARQE